MAVVLAIVLKLSVTLNTTLADDATLGVPDTNPLPVLSVMPVGNVPETVPYTYGVYPPETLLKVLNPVIARVCSPVTVVVAPAVADKATFTVKLTVLVVLAVILFASLTLNVTLDAVCVTVGVPDTNPVLELIVMPVGSVPELTKYVYGVVPFDTLLNGLKLAIAEFCMALTVVVAPAVAVIIPTIVKLTVTVVLAIIPRLSVTLNTTLADEYAALGVPITRPVLLLSVIPVGNVTETIP